MADFRERAESRWFQSQIQGDTLRVEAQTHFVTEAEESRRMNREIHADRATIAHAAEQNFGGRMWHGLTETYQHLHNRELLEDLHDANVDFATHSPALNDAREQIIHLRANESPEAQSLAVKTGMVEGSQGLDNLALLNQDTADTQRQRDIIARANGLVADYVRGNINEQQLQQEAGNLANDLRVELPGVFGRSQVGSDLITVARQARGVYLANQDRFSNVDVDLELVLGQVAGAMSTAEQRGIADRIVDWSQETRTRAVLVNPLTVGAAASVGAIAARIPTRFVPVVGGLAGGIFAGARRWSKENRDRYLKQREEEIGYDINPPHTPHNMIENGLAHIVGQTNFVESSYRLVSALERSDEISEMIDAPAERKQTPAWQDAALRMLAETRVRVEISEERGVGLVKYGQTRRENGTIEISGTATINRDKLNLMVACEMLQMEIGRNSGEDPFRLVQRYEQVRQEVVREMDEFIITADARFACDRLWGSLRSGAFAAGVGVIGGLGIKLLGDLAEKPVAAVADRISPAHETVITGGFLGNGTLEKIVPPTPDHVGISVEIPDGYAHQLTDEHIILDGPGGHFQIPILPIENDHSQDALVVAGLRGKVTTVYGDVQTVTDAVHQQSLASVQEKILAADFLRDHHIAEITDRKFGITFGHAEFLKPGQNEFNELTLYRHSAVDWSIGPRGLDGNAFSPFVYGEHPAWADPAIAANAPVSEKDLVVFYQLKDAQDHWHTLLAAQQNGKFTVPAEFVDQSGKVDGVSIIGYGMVRDANGYIISADKVIANPDLINGGTLHSMASIPFEQHLGANVPGDVPAGGEFLARTVKIENLSVPTRIEDTVIPHAFDFEIPIATPFAPRIFPEIARGRSEIPPYYGYGELFRRPDGSPATLVDIVQFAQAGEDEEELKPYQLAQRPRRATRARRQALPPAGSYQAESAPSLNQSRERRYSVAQDFGASPAEGIRAMEAIRRAYFEAQRVYVGLSGAIGDVVIDTAYLEGLRAYAEKTGQKKDITIITPGSSFSLVYPLAQKYGWEVYIEPRPSVLSLAKKLANERNEKSVVFEFDHHTGRPHVENIPNGLVVSDLLISSAGLYDLNRSGGERFGDYFSDLLSIEPENRIEIRPRIELPENSDQIYSDLVKKYGVDTGKWQVAVVIEASTDAKRYSLGNWRSVLRGLKRRLPNVEFNIIYNPGVSYPEQEVQKTFENQSNTRIVTGNLSEMMVFLANQKLVVSNDTGLSHIAAVVEGGPQVVGLNLPSSGPNIWVTDETRHRRLLPKTENLNGDFDWNETNEAKKWINKISPNDVVAAAVEAMRKKKEEEDQKALVRVQAELAMRVN